MNPCIANGKPDAHTEVTSVGEPMGWQIVKGAFRAANARPPSGALAKRLASGGTQRSALVAAQPS